VVSVGVTKIAISVAHADAGAAGHAVSSFRRFYPECGIELAGSTVSLSSSTMGDRHLRTAWLCHLLEAKNRDQASRSRESLLRDLFN